MPKLYYTPTSCGAASFISAFSAGLKLDCEEVTNLGNGSLASDPTPGAFWKVNPKGNVPCLVLDDGTLLIEGSSVLSYINDLAAGSLAPSGPNGRYLLLDAISFIGTELHSSHGGLWNPAASEEVKGYYRTLRESKFQTLTDKLEGKDFLLGSTFSAADAYCYIVLSWAAYLKAPLDKFPVVEAYFNRVRALEKVQAAHARMNAETKPTTTF